MGKNYIVVGGSQGIGLALTKQLVEEGHNLTVLSRTKGELDSISNVNHVTYDVTSGEAIDLTVDSIDGIAYCPGTINLKPFHGLKENDFKNDFEINVMGAIRTIQTFLKPLKKGNDPSIVLFSTIAVQQGMSFHSSIAVSKGAIEGLTRSLAAELSPTVRVNCIAPSITNTPLAQRLLSSPEKEEASAKRHPLNRVGSAEDIASMATFLLSNKSSWMTGQVLGVDGGMSSVKSL